jgi:uncharacterized protein (TIGR02271 family)
VADEGKLELREEQLVVKRELQEVGEIRMRTVVGDVPGRREVDARTEEVEVERVPVGQAVSERRDPWEEDGVIVVPVYEEQLVVSKRLIEREHLRIRRVVGTRHELFEDRLRRERVVIEDPRNTGLVHERYPTDDPADDSKRT